jgi:hypothetical protein
VGAAVAIVGESGVNRETRATRADAGVLLGAAVSRSCDSGASAAPELRGPKVF